jgi:hypothetical protein
MIVLVGGNHEQRIRCGNTVLGEPSKELAESLIIGLELTDVGCLTGA